MHLAKYNELCTWGAGVGGGGGTDLFFVSKNKR
jgi:hypothetical protein